MRLLIFVLVTVSMAVVAVPAEARVQRDMICWIPDWEFPVDCDEEE